MTPLVQLADISKRFPGVHALRGVDLELYAGEVHALVGENGAGKSTLLNVFAGLLRPDGGTIRVDGQAVTFADARAAWAAGVVTVHQEVDLFPDLRVLENVGWQRGFPRRGGLIDWREQRRRTAAALADVEAPVSADDRAGDLTPAHRQIVEIAAAVSHAARVLVLDEPTSSLSAAEAARLFAHVRRFRDRGTAVVYVSHRLEEVFALADRVTVLRDGRRVWTGAVAETSPADLIRHMVGRAVTTSRQPHDRTPGPMRLACHDLTAADGSFRDVTLEVRGGEIVGLYGLIGAGRTEWAQAVFGLRPIARGTVAVDSVPITPSGPGQMARHGVAYVPEDRLREGICRTLGVGLNAVLASLRRLSVFGWLPPGREQTRATTITAALGVRMASLDQPVGTLSGGNQQKVVVGRWLDRDPAVLLLDEPTRGVDVGAREEIYGHIRRQAEAGRAVVVISSDLPEMMALADRVGVFRAGRLAAVLRGDTADAETVARLAFPVEEKASVGPAMLPRGRWRQVGELIRGELGLAVFVALFFASMQLATGQFLHADSLASRATDAALLGVCALAAMLVLVAGGLDISLGALMALSAGVAGGLWEHGAALPLVFLVAVGVGAAGGALNATLSLVGGVHPIVVTLGTMSVFRGLAHWWLGQDVQIPDAQRQWALANVLGVPLVVWLGVAVAAAAAVVLRYTVAGRQLIALGSNPRAAHRVGIHRGRVWLAAFTVQGALIGLAGLLYLARAGSLQSTSHEDRTLQAIAAAVVGGVAITGGRGSVIGVALGSLLLVSLGSAAIFLGVSPSWEQTLVGGTLLVAVLFDALARGRKG